jgi:hypothetical protein
MKKLLYFEQFLNESTAAGNRDESFTVPFKYSSKDSKSGYNSKSFVDDLESIIIEKPELEMEIKKFLKDSLLTNNIEDLAQKPFSYIIEIIPEIERIIDAGEFEPEVTMPGGSVLFIRNKKLEDGTEADFYINRKGSKIEVVYDDEDGKEKCEIFTTSNFPFDSFNFTEDDARAFSNRPDIKINFSRNTPNTINDKTTYAPICWFESCNILINLCIFLFYCFYFYFYYMFFRFLLYIFLQCYYNDYRI